MRIIFVRHGVPDYTTDTLTEKGKKEAEALAQRTKDWDVEKIYVSPLGRARETAQPTLDALGMEPVVYDWLREFPPRFIDKTTGAMKCCWDLMPQDYTRDPKMMDPHEWYHGDVYAEHPEVEECAKAVYAGMDQLLESYGYFRHGDKDYFDFVDPIGHVNPAEVEDIMIHGTSDYELRDEDDEKTIVIVCHLGVTCVMLGYLLGISPVALWHGTCIPPTGVTVVNAEKRLHNTAHFRIQSLGDTAHLYAANVPVSGYAGFAPAFQK